PSSQAILKALGQLWMNGMEPDWAAFYQDEFRRRQHDVPTYAFDKQTYWVDAIPRDVAATASVVIEAQEAEIVQNGVSGKQQLINKIKDILENASGFEMGGVTEDMSFIEI